MALGGLVLWAAQGCDTPEPNVDPAPVPAPAPGWDDDETTKAPDGAAAETAKTRSAPTAAGEPAHEILTQLVAGKHAPVRAHFDAAMDKAFSTDAALETWWRNIIKQTGEFQRVFDTRHGIKGDTSSVTITSYFATEPWDVAMEFDAAGKLSGIAVRTSDHPGLRAQTPKPPFDYTIRDTTFEGDGGNQMGGTLTLPKGPGPHPAVILISGSGSHDRDATVSGHRPFLLIADTLTRGGFVVLRYDDRGVGDSKGDPTKDTIESVAADAMKAVTFLKTRPEVDASRVGVVGHSIGGSVAPWVATKTKCAFVVTLAGSTVSGVELIPEQVGTLRLSEGRPAAVVDEIVAEQRKLVVLLAADAPAEEVDAALRAVAKANAKLADKPTPAVEQALQGVLRKQMSLPWYISFVKFDPAPHLKALKKPILMLHGSKDVVLPPELNRKPAEALLAGNGRARVETLPGLNHLFQTAETGAMSEYVLIDETIAPQVLRIMTTWMREQAGLD